MCSSFNTGYPITKVFLKISDLFKNSLHDMSSSEYVHEI